MSNKNHVSEIVLGSMPLSNELLEKKEHGYWAIEIEPNKEKRIYVDNDGKDFIRLPHSATPEETYAQIKSFMSHSQQDLVLETLDKMKCGQRIEWIYMIRMDNEEVFIRAEGMMNTNYKNGLRFEGYYEHIDNILRINREIADQQNQLITNSIEIYDFVYAVDLIDKSYKILRIQPWMLNQYKVLKTFDDIKFNMLNYVIHPSDRKLMEHELDYDVIRQKISKHNIYTIEYRVLIQNKSYWNQMTVTKIDDDNVCMGFASNDREVILRLLQEKMSQHFYALFEVDFDADLLKLIQKDDNTIDFPMDRTIPYSLWIKSISKFQNPEASELLLKLRKKDFVYNVFKTENTLTFSSLSRLKADQEPQWINTTVYCIKRNEDGTPSIFTIGFSSADKMELENKELQRKVDQNIEMIKGLAEEYSALFYLDLNHDSFEIYSYKTERIGTLWEGFDDKLSGPQILNRFADSPRVHPDDKHIFKGIDNAYIRKRLEKNKRFTIRFRLLKDGEYTWCEFDFIKYEKVQEVANKIALGFAERDTEIKSEETVSRCMDIVSSQLPPKEAINRLLNIISEFYGAETSFILEFDPKEKIIQNIFEWTKEGVEPMDEIFKVREKEMIEGIVDKFNRVGPFFKDFVNDTTPDNLARFRESFNMACTPIYNGSTLIGCVGGMNLTKALGDSSIVRYLGVLIYSEILRNRQEEETKLLVNRFANNYKASFIINAKNDTYRSLISYNGTFANFIEGDSYLNGVTKYFSQVYEDDREEMLKVIQFDYLFDKFKQEQEFAVRYRCLVHGFTFWLEARFSKLNDEEFIFAIADVDEMNGKEMLEQVISTNFNALFLIDLKTDTLKIVKMIEPFDSKFAHKTIPYSATISHIVSDVTEKYKENWLAVSNTENTKKYLLNYDKRELIHEDVKSRGSLSRCVFYVIDRDPDGTPHTVSISFTKLDDEQSEKEILNEKIAEQNIILENQGKALAEALENAEASSRSKTSFLFNMSHDIRTPMNAIRGFTIMAKKYIDNTDRVSDYLSKIDVSSNQLLLLINQVLEMSRIESGKIELAHVSTNCKEKFESVITVFSAQAKIKGIEFNYEYKNVQHERIFSDEARVTQIINNIIGNALKYTPEDGKVSVAFEEIAPRKEGYATFLISCEDTGIGMSEEFQKQIFLPFSREQSSTVSHIQGTGLGMTIVKALIDIMGGDIKLTSAPGKGSKFEVILDCEIDNENHEEEREFNVKAINFNGKRILLVEDNEMNREIAVDILSDAGLTIETASDGDVAVNKIQEVIDRNDCYYYDAILMDIQMPRMNGYEATRAIRELLKDYNPRIPIIAMTANAFEEDRNNAKEAGMDDHLAKPIEVEKLFGTLIKFLD